MPGGMAAVPSVTAPDGTVLNTANAALSLQPPSVLVRPGCLACSHEGGSMSKAKGHRIISCKATVLLQRSLRVMMRADASLGRG